jgi:uncharacterized protein YecT (DUF1311 family)
MMCVQAVSAAPLKITKHEIKQQKPTHEIDISYPLTGLPRIDAEIEPWARKLAADFASEATEAGETRPWSSELSFDIPRNDGKVLSIVFSHNTYTGGAHPNSSYRTFHFLLPEGYRADIAELFSPRGIRRISHISISQLKQDLAGPDGMSDTDWIKRGAGPNARNFENFILTPSELKVLFDAYQVAAYAAGPREVKIPLSQLRDALRPDPRAPAASFECLAARGPTETGICSSRDLARLDRLMGEAYVDALTWDGDEAKRRARQQGQRAWVAQRDAACGNAGARVVDCLTPLYEARIKVLNAR